MRVGRRDNGRAGAPVEPAALRLAIGTLALLLALGIPGCGGASPEGRPGDEVAADPGRDETRDLAGPSPDRPDLPEADAEPPDPDDGGFDGDGEGDDRILDVRFESADTLEEAPVPGDAGVGDAPGVGLWSIEPAEGPAGAPTTVTLRGSGFVDGMEVFFGARKGLYPFVLSGHVANVTSPPGEAGRVDVSVELPGGASAKLPGAFVYRGGLSLGGVEPSSGPSAGGSPVTVRGSGFLNQPIFLFGGREAPVVRVVDDRQALVITPPGEPGFVSVSALAGDSSVRLEDGFTYQDEGVPPSNPSLRVLSCSPASGPPEGGTRVTLVGTGFRPDASVRVGALPATEVTFVSDSMLTARTAPGSPGPARILVRQSTAGAWLDGAFEYAVGDGPEILSVDPPDGAWSGGTLVRLAGRNLSDLRRVFFGGGEATDLHVVSSVLVEVRTPRAFEVGTVPVMVVGGGIFLGAAFTYFDPYLLGGGTWGGPARDSVNVTVTGSSTGKGLPDAYVIIGDDPHTPLQGRTDSRGQITLSEAGLRGPLTVTAGMEGFTASTIAGFDARNVTLSIGPAGSVENPLPPPGSTGSAKTCTVRGRVKDYGKYLVKPPWVEGTPYVQCGVTASSLFGGGPDAGPKSIPDPEGRFEVLARSGTFGVLCQMLVVDPSKGWAVPLRMGMVRRLSCKADEVIEGVVVSLDVETDAELWVATSPAPSHPLGAGFPGFSGGWELGEDGWLPLFQRHVRRATRTLFTNQPRSFDPPLEGLGYSFYITVSAATPVGLPYTTVLSTGVPPIGSWPALVEDGPGFAVLPTGLRSEVTALIPIDGGRGLAADAGGATWEFDGTGFQVGPYRASRAIYGLYGESASDFWVVGARGMVRHVVDGVATDVPAPVATDLTGISGAGADAISVAGGPFLLRLAEGQFVQENLPPGTDVRAVKRFPGGEIVAVGAGGAVVTGQSGDVFDLIRPIARDLRAVAGLDPDEVWVVGDRGTLIRLGGDDITVRTAPGEPDLSGVIVLGPSNLLLYGPGGTLLYFDGTRFTDRSRPDLRVDLMAGASVGGRAVLAGRQYLEVPRFLPFPEVLEPRDLAPWSGRRIAWSLGGVESDPSYSQAILSGPLGSPFWIVLAGGDVREVALPDLSRVLGRGPVPAGDKRMNLTVSRAPGFTIDEYGYQDLGFYDREAFSVALASFP